MYAIVRENTFDPITLRDAGPALDEFQEIHDSQPGYRGTLVVDAGDGRSLTVNLWESEQRATAALPIMVPVVQRLVEPLMAAPSRLIAGGPVTMTDLTRAPSAPG